MKKITLYGAGVRNDGRYVDAGETVSVGNDDDEIASARAKEMVRIGTAVSMTAAKAEERAAEERAAEERAAVQAESVLVESALAAKELPVTDSEAAA